MNDLYDQIVDAEEKITQFGKLLMDQPLRFLTLMTRAFQLGCSKPGTNVTIITIESYTQAFDFSVMVAQSLPAELQTWIGGDELPSLPDLKKPMFSDIAFRVDGQQFRCHKVFFCGRSDFFKAMINDHFLEHEETDDLPVYTLHNISAGVFTGLVSYVYLNQAEFTLENVYELLTLSDLYLLPGLKRQAANFVGRNLDKENVIDILKLARLFELVRLELDCSAFMANNIEFIASRADFEELVLEDASLVRQRQETDSIDIIDDIRYHITSNVQTFSGMEEATEKLRRIDNLLEKLNLVA